METNWQEFTTRIDEFAPLVQTDYGKQIRRFMGLSFNTVEEIVSHLKKSPQLENRIDNYKELLDSGYEFLWDSGLQAWLSAIADGDYESADKIKKQAEYNTSDTKRILNKVNPTELPEHHYLLHQLEQDRGGTVSGVKYSRFPGNVFARTP